MIASRLALACAVAAALAAAPAAAQDAWSWNGAVAPGRTLEIKGVNGPIRATPAQGSEVRVTAQKRARRSNPDGVTFEVIQHGDGVTICAVYPPVRNRRNECAPGDGGRMSVQNNDVSVEWIVQVPRGVHLRASTVNGGVEATGLTGDTHAATVNGDVRVSTAGFATAATVNGSVNVAMGNTTGRRPMAFSTVNGSIVLSLAGGTNADLSASTVTGDIEADFPIQVQGRWGPKIASAQIGSGGPTLKLSTVNGSITVRTR